MTSTRIVIAALAATLAAACGGSSDGGGGGGTAPGAPTGVSVAAGTSAGSAVVHFTAPTMGDAPTSYTVTATPGDGGTPVRATGASSPITVTGLAPGPAHTFGVVASNAAGSSPAATTGSLRFYSVVLTVREPMTWPNDTIFTGTYTFDATSRAVTNLSGRLTQSMTKPDGTHFGPPMTTVALTHQLDATPATLGGVEGLLVTTFFLDTVNTFDPSGFAPGGTEYYGLAAGQPNPRSGGVGNAYAMIFVPSGDPTATLAQAQIDRLAYADCTAGGMMMNTCMTGTTMAGYGRMGTMMGVPVAQVTTEYQGGASPPGAPTGLGVAAGTTPGSAVVSFTAPTVGDAPTTYTVTARPGTAGTPVTTTGATSPITLTGLAPQTAYTYRVVAASAAGASDPALTNALRFYSVVETFREPMTQPNDTIFTGTFTFDTTARVVSNLAGSITESMTKPDGTSFGPPMTTVALAHQLDATPATLGGVEGLLVTTFFLDTVNTFDPSGFAPGGTQYYGLAAGLPSPKNGGVGNAYAMIFVPTADPAAALAQAQIDRLAYADCTAGGMMMTSCMTGTTVAGYGRLGTMQGYPLSQSITER